MAVPNINTLFPEIVPALGDCADCGQTVFLGESFIRTPEGTYVCVECVAGRCVLCASSDAFVTDEEFHEDGDKAELCCSGCRTKAGLR